MWVTAAALVVAACGFQSQHSGDRGLWSNRRAGGTGDLSLFPDGARFGDFDECSRIDASY